MLKAREILRLKHDIGLSLREIGSTCRCGKSTVADVLSRAEKAEVTWPIIQNDKQLMSLLYPPIARTGLPPEPDMDYIYHEMKKKNVTLLLLWEEYKEQHAQGIMYTQFCQRYKGFKQQNNVSMHKEHKAGEEMEVDWAGSTVGYYDRIIEREKKAYLFIAVLPASSYPFVHAYADTKTPSWLDAHVRAFNYYGGVARILIPDNCRTAISKADLIDPVVNKSYHELARHYGITIVAARPYKPKDKAADEGMVKIVSQRIIARLRNRQFFSLEEVNKAISEELAILVERPFQKMQGNRKTAFIQIDQPALQPLPKQAYEYADWKERRVPFNYHVDYDKYYYSVHYSQVHKPCSVRATLTTIEIFIDGERVAAHARSYHGTRRYTTLPEHMPENHKIVSGWSSDRFLSWAKKIGPHTTGLIEKILESREYPVQTYRACMGILQFQKNYSAEHMERASNHASEKRLFSYKYFKLALNQLDTAENTPVPAKIIVHANIRGNSAFAEGGLHV